MERISEQSAIKALQVLFLKHEYETSQQLLGQMGKDSKKAALAAKLYACRFKQAAELIDPQTPEVVANAIRAMATKHGDTSYNQLCQQDADQAHILQYIIASLVKTLCESLVVTPTTKMVVLEFIRNHQQQCFSFNALCEYIALFHASCRPSPEESLREYLDGFVEQGSLDYIKDKDLYRVAWTEPAAQ